MVSPKLRTLQIVIAALVSGVLVFALITYLVNPPRSLQLSTLALVGMMACVSAAVGGIVVPGLVTRGLESRLRQGNNPLEKIEEQLVQGFLQQTILGAALVESGIFLNLVMNFVEPNFVFFIVALVLVAMMALYFPTDGSMRQWMAARRESITGRRSF